MRDYCIQRLKFVEWHLPQVVNTPPLTEKSFAYSQGNTFNLCLDVFHIGCQMVTSTHYFRTDFVIKFPLIYKRILWCKIKGKFWESNLSEETNYATLSHVVEWHSLPVIVIPDTPCPTRCVVYFCIYLFVHDIFPLQGWR